MTTYLVENAATQTVYGIVQATSPAQALDYVAQECGYDTFGDLCEDEPDAAAYTFVMTMH